MKGSDWHRVNAATVSTFRSTEEQKVSVPGKRRRQAKQRANKKTLGLWVRHLSFCFVFSWCKLQQKLPPRQDLHHAGPSAHGVRLRRPARPDGGAAGQLRPARPHGAGGAAPLPTAPRGRGRRPMARCCCRLWDGCET